jgi:hypothetical protein
MWNTSSMLAISHPWSPFSLDTAHHLNLFSLFFTFISLFGLLFWGRLAKRQIFILSLLLK